MKRILGILTIIATTAILSAANLMAAEDTIVNQKDECLLVSKNCADSVDTIYQRIDRLRGEIAKGTDVYTNDELNKLNNKLDEMLKNLDVLESS